MVLKSEVKWLITYLHYILILCKMHGKYKMHAFLADKINDLYFCKLARVFGLGL